VAAGLLWENDLSNLIKGDRFPKATLHLMAGGE